MPVPVERVCHPRPPAPLQKGKHGGVIGNGFNFHFCFEGVQGRKHHLLNRSLQNQNGFSGQVHHGSYLFICLCINLKPGKSTSS